MTTGRVVFVLTLTALVWVFLFWRLGVASRLRRRTTRLVGVALVPFVLLTTGGMGLSLGVPDPKAWRPLTASLLVGAALLLYVVLGTVVQLLVAALWRLYDALRGRIVSPEIQGHRVRRLNAGVLAIAVLTTAYGFVEASTPTVSRITVTSGDLPAEFDGYRVALVTDVHVGPGRSGAFLADAVRQVNAEDVDMVVVAGDLVDGTVAGLGAELRPLSDLRGKQGVVITTGNHEFYSGASDWVAEWRGRGLTVLTNQSMVLRRGTASIDVLGVNDRSGTPPLAEDLEAALATLPAQGVSPADTGRFRLLIAHQPRQARTGGNLAARSGVDLQLSGHTHGGQLWPLHYAVPLQQGTLAGMDTLGGIPVYTSRGVGGFGPPVRVGAPPEIPVVTLRRG